MGRVRVPGLAYSLDYLRSELRTFHEMVERDSWMTDQSLNSRRGAVKAITFIMLNLGDDVDRTEAWTLFHIAMDEYHDRCDRFHITY